MSTVTVFIPSEEEDERKRRRAKRGVIAVIAIVGALALPHPKPDPHTRAVSASSRVSLSTSSGAGTTTESRPWVGPEPRHDSAFQLAGTGGKAEPDDHGGAGPDGVKIADGGRETDGGPASLKLPSPLIATSAGDMTAEACVPQHLCINPTVMAFQSGAETITLTNPDDAAVHVRAIHAERDDGAPSSAYDIAADGCVRLLAPGEQCRFTIVANPLAPQLRERLRVEVVYDGPDQVFKTVAMAVGPINRR
jgi:hypothetical protein